MLRVDGAYGLREARSDEQASPGCRHRSVLAVVVAGGVVVRMRVCVVGDGNHAASLGSSGGEGKWRGGAHGCVQPRSSVLHRHEAATAAPARSLADGLQETGLLRVKEVIRLMWRTPCARGFHLLVDDKERDNSLGACNADASVLTARLVVARLEGR